MGFLEDVRVVAGELELYRTESLSGVPPVVHQAPIAEVIETLGPKDHLENGTLNGEALAEFVRRYLDLTVRLHHPSSLAHQVAVSHPAAALAVLVEGVTNNPMAIYRFLRVVMTNPETTLDDIRRLISRVLVIAGSNQKG